MERELPKRWGFVFGSAICGRREEGGNGGCGRSVGRQRMRENEESCWVWTKVVSVEECKKDVKKGRRGSGEGRSPGRRGDRVCRAEG